MEMFFRSSPGQRVYQGRVFSQALLMAICTGTPTKRDARSRDQNIITVWTLEV